MNAGYFAQEVVVEGTSKSCRSVLRREESFFSIVVVEPIENLEQLLLVVGVAKFGKERRVVGFLFVWPDEHRFNFL